jgi:hypothetical protein
MYVICLPPETTSMLLLTNLSPTTGFLDNTPFYSDIGEKIMDPQRGKKIDASMPNLFVDDVALRRKLNLSGFIENRLLGTTGSEEERAWLEELLWNVLYP